MDALRHSAAHRWTIAPLAAAVTAAVAAAAIPAAGLIAATAAAVAAIPAAVNVLRIAWETSEYTAGKRERPKFITPTPEQAHHAARSAAPPGLYLADPSSQKWRCSDCPASTDVIYELKSTHRGRSSSWKFALCDNCLTKRTGRTAQIVALKIPRKKQP